MLKIFRFFCSVLAIGTIGFGGSVLEAQTDGPAVQVFTASGSGETQVVALERLPVKVTVSVNAGYDTNVGTSDIAQQNSFYSSASLSLSYPFGTERTRGNISTSASVTYYDNGEDGGFQYDPNLGLQFSLAHDISPRLTLNSAVYLRYGIEPDFALGLGENRRSGNYFTTADSLSASYAWYERFSTVTTYTLNVVRYDDDAVGQFLNRWDHGFAQQFRFLLLPVTTIVGDYRLSVSQYQGDGQDSFAQFFLIGIDHTIGPHLQGSIRGGAELRSSDQSEDTFTPYGEASLSYAIGERTSVSWNARYSKADSNSIFASSRTSFSTGLQMRFGLTPRISGTLAAYYNNDQNEGRKISFFQFPSFTEQSFDIGGDLTYAISPRWSASAGSHYTQVSSDFNGRDYGRARYYGGLNYSF